VIIVEFQKLHFMITLWTLKRIIAKREKDKFPPCIEVQDAPVFGTCDCFMKRAVYFPVACIETVITGHFKMLIRDVLNEKLYKIQYRHGFLDIGIVFVFIVVKSHIFSVIRINARGGDNWTPKISADVFDNSIGIAEIWFCINVEAVFIFLVDERFCLFKGITDTGFQQVEQGGLESLAKIFVIEILDDSPKAIIREPSFREKAVDVRVPFEGSAECMKHTDKARDKVFRFVKFVEHFQKDTAYSLKETVKERRVFKEKVAEIIINGKNKMAMGTTDQFKRHFG